MFLSFTPSIAFPYSRYAGVSYLYKSTLPHKVNRYKLHFKADWKYLSA
jgi:hypothetical protein